MHCENHNHHHSNEGCCDNSPRQHDHNNHEYQRCSMARTEQHAPNHNPHDMHYHINKYAVRAWLMNALYLSLHAVEIYLIIKLV